jgi:Zn-finger nucleic acid-binding protein
MATCPKCRTSSLAPLSDASAGGGVPLRCSACRGVWVPRHAILFSGLDDFGRAPDHPSLDAKVGRCPAGHGLLRRARLEGELRFALDRCPTCGGTWFDAGEWHELATRHLLTSLDDLWDPLKQRRARETKALERWRAELERRLGPKLLGQVEKLGDALAGHDDAAQALAFLEERIRGR